MSSRWNTKPLSHGSSSTLQSGLESVRHVGISRGCTGHATAHVFLSLWLYGCGQTAQIPGQWICQPCGMGGCWPTRQSCYRCGAPRLGGNGGQTPQRESHYPVQPSNQGLPINPTKRVLRSFKGGNGQSPPNMASTVPAPTSGNGLADPAVLLPLLQSLGLPEEVLELVRARVAQPKTPKKISWEKELSLLRAKIDVLDQSVLLHQDKLRENEDALSTKQQERAQLDIAFRDLTAKGFTPTPSPVRTPVQSDNEGYEGVVGGRGGCSRRYSIWNKILVVSGAVREFARPVAGTAKKRRCLDSAQVLNEVVEREIAQLSKVEALRFQALCSQQAERAEDVEMGTLEILHFKK